MKKVKEIAISEEEVVELVLGSVNTAIDESIREITEDNAISVEQFMEDYSFALKKALFVARNQI